MLHRTPIPPHEAAKRRIGQVQLSALRTFWAARKREVRTSEVMVWAYPQSRAPYHKWQYLSARRALSRWAERAGYRGREVVWRLRDDAG